MMNNETKAYVGFIIVLLCLIWYTLEELVHITRKGRVILLREIEGGRTLTGDYKVVSETDKAENRTGSENNS